MAYTLDRERKFEAMGVVPCGTARAGIPSATSYKADCVRNGSGGIYASGGIFLGARYLNVNGTIQSGQADYQLTLTNARVDSTITAWKKHWADNRGAYQAQGRSPLVQVAGRAGRHALNGSETGLKWQPPTSPGGWWRWWAPSSIPAAA